MSTLARFPRKQATSGADPRRDAFAGVLLGAIIGAYFFDDPEKRHEFVLASSRLTHRGWQAETAALAVAQSAACTLRAKGKPNASDVIARLRGLSSEDEWQGRLSQIQAALQARYPSGISPAIWD